ncbi:MAG TPA: hypothetical protein VGB06_06465 [Solirubrobacterales bacterium]|jgi:hypothetical protein
MAEGDRERYLPSISEVVGEDERPAEPTLEPGIERVDEFVVGGPLLTDVGGTIGTKVLSTPAMIAMMERCSSLLAIANLPQGRATVGFEVCQARRRGRRGRRVQGPLDPPRGGRRAQAPFRRRGGRRRAHDRRRHPRASRNRRKPAGLGGESELLAPL